MNSVRPHLMNPYLDLFQVLSTEPEGLQVAVRKKLIWPYSWAIPTSEAIYAIAQYSSIVELGAGTGYWAFLIAQAGGQVAAFDHEPCQSPHWYPIQRGGPSSLKEHPDRALFLCWPPFETRMAFESLEAYEGNTLIYVGEWNGRTGDSDFHRRLETHWLLCQEVMLPNWPGFKDRLYILKRNLVAQPGSDLLSNLET